MQFSIAKVVLIATPPLLLTSTFAVFQITSSALGARPGYFVGFLFYWLAWCLLLSLALLGPRGVRSVFKSSPHPLGRPRWIGAGALILPLILGFGYAFSRASPEAFLLVLLTSALLALINGTMEELLWRGAYTSVFRDSWLFGWLYPSIGFGLWHFAPQSIFPSPAPGGTLSLVFVAILLGLLWGWVAKTTGSIRWTTISHVVFNFSGLGARLYFG